ncbi:hypothetical protein HD806DRAFT_550791 [Xylariaceae sp. AK1471]|nr:hypothetical protein HD806DRAFT_550791 [Xylariaceae sp. AK1471]
MAYVAPSWAYMQQFPARDAKDRTNKFGVVFDDCSNRSVGSLRELFASKFKLVSNKSDSFQTWRQKSGKEHGLTFLMVDMDQIQVEDLVKASIDLEEIIKSEDGLVLRQNNRDSWIGIEWPCGCGQEHSPFPSFEQTPGPNKSIPIPGHWHDPNRCNGQHPPSIASVSQDADGKGTFGYTPVAKRTFLPAAKGILTPRLATVASPATCGPIAAAASSAYAPEDASAASPTRKVKYAARFQDLASPGPTYKAIVPPFPYTASPPKSPYEAVAPQAAYKVPAAGMTLQPDGATISPYLIRAASQTPHMANAVTPMSRPLNAVAPTPVISRLPADTSVAMADWAHRDYKYSLIKRDDDNNQDQGEREEYEAFEREEQVFDPS